MGIALGKHVMAAMKLKAKVWLERRGRFFGGDGGVPVLKMVHRTGCIERGARPGRVLWVTMMDGRRLWGTGGGYSTPSSFSLVYRNWRWMPRRRAASALLPRLRARARRMSSRSRVCTA